MPYSHQSLLLRDGLRMVYRDYPAQTVGQSGGEPQAVTIVCLGGLTRNSKDFAKVAEWLSGMGYRVLCPDYRGRGLSDYDADPSNYRPDVYLDDIRHLLTVTGVHRVFVVGTSLGGLLAMGMSAAMPTVLAGAVLNDIGPIVDLRRLDGVAKYIATRPSFASFEEAAAHMKTWFPDFPAETDDEWLGLAYCGYKQREDGAVVFDFDPAIGNPLTDPKAPKTIDIQPLFNGLAHVPLASVRGAKSGLFPAEAQQAMAAQRPDMICTTIDGVGHCPSLNEPAARAAIQEVLNRVA